MAILENYNIEVEDLTLGELYPTKKAMNDDMENIANRGYCQPKEQYVFSADYILKPQFVEHQEIGAFGSTTTKVYNTTFKPMYETNKIRHNFCLLKRPTTTDQSVYNLLRMWSFPLNPTYTAEYDETLEPSGYSIMEDYQFVKSFNYNECVYKPTFTFVKIDEETGKINTNYIEGDSSYFRSLDGLREIVESNRNDIYLSSFSWQCALWNKNTNEWNYSTHLIPMIYGFNEVNCLQAFGGLFSPTSFTIPTSRSNETTGLTTTNQNRLKTHYYDYYEGTTRRTYASNLVMNKAYPEFTFVPFDLDNYENGKTQIIQEDDDSVFIATQSSGSTTNITFQFRRLLKPKFVYKKLAELGLYMTSRKGVISGYFELFCGTTPPNELMNRDDTYLGEMLDGGLTTGVFLRGSEITDSKTPNKSGSNIDINYKPSFDVSDDDIIDRFRYGGFNRANDFLISYIMNSEKLTQLAAEFKQPTNPIPTGDTPFDSIVGLRKYPINLTRYVETYSATAQNIKLSSWDTNVKATVLLGNNANINIGSFYIEPKFNNFLDYEPYTSAEMYLPFAEFVPISLNKCMGNTVDIEMIFDAESGNIQYLVMCEGLLIAEASGNISSSQALSGVNFGLKNLQDVQNSFGLYSNAVSTVSSVANGNIAGAFAKGILSIMQMGHNEQVIANANYSTQKGQTQTDVSQYSLLDVVLHLSRPVVKVPSNYGKTIGYILNETKVLNELTGYTICNNVIINNVNCLGNEKTEIKNLLETGVIL